MNCDCGREGRIQVDPLAGRIREVEAQILDKHHEEQALLRRSQVEAVSHLLKMYGNIVREFLSPELRQVPTNSWLTELEFWTRALEQSLRWALEYCQANNRLSGESWRQIDEEALSLLSWAHSYVKLCIDHTAASRGRYMASFDENRREIRFQLIGYDLTMLVGQVASWPVHTADLLKSMPEPELRRFFEPPGSPRPISRSSTSLRTCLHSSTILRILTSSRSTSGPEELFFPELGDQEDLSGFLGQLRDLWASLFIQCQMVTRLEEHVDRVMEPNNDLGSLMYQGTNRELANYFSHMCGVDRRTISSMIDCLTFDAKSPKSTATNSPFVKTQCGTVSLLCRRVVTLDPNLMLSSALAKRSRKRVYDHLINKIERQVVAEIAKAFQNAGFVVIAQPTLESRSGERICPDLVIYEPTTERVLITDYKHALPPFGAAEVDNRLRDLDEWTEQVRVYLSFSETNREIITDRLKCVNIARADGMLLFRWPLAIPGMLQADVTYADWTSLAVGLRCVEGLAITDILRLYRLPRDADQILWQWEVGEESISVGRWTYKRPLIVQRGSSATD